VIHFVKKCPEGHIRSFSRYGSDDVRPVLCEACDRPYDWREWTSTHDPLSADQVRAALTAYPAVQPCQAWCRQAALIAHPRPEKWQHNGFYDTTRTSFYHEVTVRLPEDGLTRRGKPRFQRRRLDLVALILPHYKTWRPVLAGVEIKVGESDLMNDTKLTDYLAYVDLFYLAVPGQLINAALGKIEGSPALATAGLLEVGPQDTGPGYVQQVRCPTLTRPELPQLAEIYAELLIKPLKEREDD
jgi:hypothetical protein